MRALAVAAALVVSSPAWADAPPVDEFHPRGKIRQSYRDGAVLKLYLDLGSAAHLHPGMHGAVLVGAEGDAELEGATFTITKVVDSKTSIAQIADEKIVLHGNNRYVVYLIKK